MQDYEETVSFLGQWGRFQRRIFFVLCLICISAGYNILSFIFLLDTPTHRCHIPIHANLNQDWVQASIPVQEVDGRLERSSCSRYQLDLIQNLSALGWSPDELSDLKQEGCVDGWTYSTEFYQSTVATEFNLVCRDQWKQPLTSLMYFLGGLIGSLVSGPISDRFGRKPVLFGSVFTLSFFSGTLAFAPSWPVFILLFFIVGLGQISSYVVVFVLGSELLIGPSRVLFCSLGLPFVYVFSTFLLPGSAYFVGAGVSSLAGVSWVVTGGGACSQVEKASLQGAESLGFLDLLRTRNIRHITLVLWLIWFLMAVCYFGLSFNSTGLHGNLYLNFMLLSAVEFPAYAFSWIGVRSFPRRLSFSAFALLGALSLLLIWSGLSSDPLVTLSLVLLGKFGLLGGSSVLYVFTGELYPTIIRNSALSSCTSFSRLGSSLSPYLLQLMALYDFLPWLVIVLLSLLCAFLCIFLPETLRQPLPDSIQQMAPAQRWPCTKTAKHDGKLTTEQTTEGQIICATHL
ncbi:hypothetical protein LDENG_00240060 [Lucifuga dentata]|nr:hypothetical protein LDENG_00240060 [Lucifuga dentata]